MNDQEIHRHNVEMISKNMVEDGTGCGLAGLKYQPVYCYVCNVPCDLTPVEVFGDDEYLCSECIKEVAVEIGALLMKGDS